MDTTELRDCTTERLNELEKTLRRQIFEARIKNFTNQLDDTAFIRRTKKDLARVKTILSERVIREAEEASVEANAATEAEETE